MAIADPKKRLTTTTKPAVVEITVRPAGQPPAEEEDVAPVFYRGAEYWLPGFIVRAPLTPKVMRQLEKAQIFAVNHDRTKMVGEFRKMLVSTSDIPTLVKVAAAAHSEGLAEEAAEALRKAVRVADRQEALLVPVVQGIGTQLGYAIEAPAPSAAPVA